jgi:hypothetical protein
VQLEQRWLGALRLVALWDRLYEPGSDIGHCLLFRTAPECITLTHMSWLLACSSCTCVALVAGCCYLAMLICGCSRGSGMLAELACLLVLVVCLVAYPACMLVCMPWMTGRLCCAYVSPGACLGKRAAPLSARLLYTVGVNMQCNGLLCAAACLLVSSANNT